MYQISTLICITMQHIFNNAKIVLVISLCNVIYNIYHPLGYMGKTKILVFHMLTMLTQFIKDITSTACLWCLVEYFVMSYSLKNG